MFKEFIQTLLNSLKVFVSYSFALIYSNHRINSIELYINIQYFKGSLRSVSESKANCKWFRETGDWEQKCCTLWEEPSALARYFTYDWKSNSWPSKDLREDQEEFIWAVIRLKVTNVFLSSYFSINFLLVAFSRVVRVNFFQVNNSKSY